MSQIFIAREKCGCMAAAMLYKYPEMASDIVEWLREGYTVSCEERDTVGFERCARHQAEWDAQQR